MSTVKIVSILFSFILSYENLYAFGRPGSSGSNGRNGSDGREGSYAEIYLDGNYKKISSKGESGKRGMRGFPGRNASSCWHARGHSNVYGADGGHGGHGGDGGDGGNGANATIFATELAALKQLELDTSGGMPGFSGSAGSGGRGCPCNPKSWTQQRCRTVAKSDGTTRQECHQDRYYCYEGRTGQKGQRGRMGKRGSYGKVYVFLAQNRPEEAVGKIRIRLTDIDSDTYKLSYDLWEKRSSAKSYFHAGSKVARNFHVWLGQESKKVRVDWLASRSNQEFEDEYLTLEFTRDGFRYSYPKGVWLKIDYDETKGVIKILDAMKWSEALRASWAAIGKDESWILNGRTNYRKRADDLSYLKMPGSGSRLSLSANDEVFGIDKFSKGIYKFEDESWRRFSKNLALRLAASKDKLYIIDRGYNVLVANIKDEKFESLGFKAKEISVSPENDLWLIGLDNLVYKLESDKLVDKSMKASRIAVNGDQILVVDDHKNVHQLINQKWEFIDHSIREIAISSDGKVLAIGKGYFLMEFNGLYFRPFAS